jgi:hypothetical protein
MREPSFWSMRWLPALLSLTTVLTLPAPARAIGWDRDDFIITGAPNFPDRIGIFDHDFTFKGYLEQNFLGVQGMDFDAQGRLIALSSLNPEVRIYDPSGVQVGGFTQANRPMLVPAGDLKVSPDGNYALGTNANGVRVFTPQGLFVRQYGGGDSRGIVYVPGNRLWSGGAGTTVTIFDADTGAQVGTFSANGQTQSYSMQYSAMTDTVLIVDADRDLGGVFERDLSGALIREFNVPAAQVGLYGVTRGPGGDVFGTAGKFRIANTYYDTVHWQSDGAVAASIVAYPVQISSVKILWAGLVPEPGMSATMIVIILVASAIRPPRSRGCPSV